MRTKLWIAFLLVFVGSLKAQDRPWRLELTAQPLLTHYDEDPGVRDAPQIIGNSITVLPIRLELEYALSHSVRFPGWVSVTGEWPLASISGREAGHIDRNGTSYTVQREDVQFRRSSVTAELGYDILPFLQPFALAELSRSTTRRMNQQNGQGDGSLQPDENSDYTEAVTAFHLGGGIRSIIPLRQTDATRIRFEASYANAQSVEVTNDYFGAGSWGQHTTGYRLAGRLAVDLPMSFIASARDSYLSLGVSARSIHWNGDGRVGTEIFMQPWWPRNDVTEVGAFAGLGVLF